MFFFIFEKKILFILILKRQAGLQVDIGVIRDADTLRWFKKNYKVIIYMLIILIFIVAMSYQLCHKMLD